MNEEEWRNKIREQLAQMRKSISSKADRSMVEQIKRQELEKNRYKNSASPILATTVNKGENSPERICENCVETGDLDTAFLIILRYIESISNSKADIEESNDKAERNYVEKLFDRVNLMNRQKMAEMHDGIQLKVDSSLQQLTYEFEDFSNTIKSQMITSELLLSQLEHSIEKFSGLHTVQYQQTSQTPKAQKSKLENSTSVQAEQLRKNAIVSPTKPPKKKEPTTEQLLKSVTITGPENENKGRKRNKLRKV